VRVNAEHYAALEAGVASDSASFLVRSDLGASLDSGAGAAGADAFCRGVVGQIRTLRERVTSLKIEARSSVRITGGIPGEHGSSGWRMDYSHSSLLSRSNPHKKKSDTQKVPDLHTEAGTSSGYATSR
jgi:hypothetical protein